MDMGMMRRTMTHPLTPLEEESPPGAGDGDGGGGTGIVMLQWISSELSPQSLCPSQFQAGRMHLSSRFPHTFAVPFQRRAQSVHHANTIIIE